MVVWFPGLQCSVRLVMYDAPVQSQHCSKTHTQGTTGRNIPTGGVEWSMVACHADCSGLFQCQNRDV
ncbi:Hypp183 [Branchiostoma lanceolatum]|uniref:Hypp183 protein n=1 Tax=Branchiostoma lanceolatum TaxID=7740 RepID=A0A8J9YJJ7_BRALA|nr:Hypp183 [Branchiostoma lanceolatum]